jgi:hypothetical protein
MKNTNVKIVIGFIKKKNLSRFSKFGQWINIEKAKDSEALLEDQFNRSSLKKLQFLTEE